MDNDTTPAAPSVVAYLTRIKRIPLLTAEQETDLAGRIEDGRQAESRLADRAPLSGGERARLEAVVETGRAARSEMVTANLRLVVSQVRRFTDSHSTLLDVIQEGNVGLIRAVERFDPTLGFKFSTYATWWIRQSIGRALDQQRVIHLPPKVYRRVAACREARAELHQSLGRNPSTAEIAEWVGLDEVLVRRLLRTGASTPSLDDPGIGWSAQTVPEGGEDAPARAERSLTAHHVALAVDHLPPLEREVVRMRFGLEQEPRPRTDVAHALGLGVTAVRRLERSALRRLRGWETINRLRTQNPA